ncbi:MAG: hypothetical protein IKH44_13130 [Bacteroidales bacterium]|nr:hypothetical protein [Bacteroidales bacterium]
MKNTLITIAIILGLGMTALANPDTGGLFQRGAVTDEEFYGSGFRSNAKPMLPFHEQNTNQPATTPLGGGIAVLVSLGAAYLVAKRRKE